MRFNAGYFGTCAVVLALLGTVLAGFILSVDRTTEPVTNYNYITDVSGLFSYSDVPAYIEYNPSTNYVGYIEDSTTPKYEASSTANNYRYVVSAGAVSTTTYTLSNINTSGSPSISLNPDYAESRGWHAFIKPDSTVQTYDPRIYWDGSDYDFGTPWAWAQPTNGDVCGVGSPIENSIPQITSLQTVLSAMDITGAFEKVEITITQTGAYPVLIYGGDWDISSIGQYYPYAVLNEDNAVPTDLEIDGATLTVKAYRNNTLMWEKPAVNVAVMHWYNARSNNNGISAVSCSATFDATITGLPVYGYMNPNAGVTLNGAGSIDWSNGYDNNEVTIKVLKPSSSAKLTITANASPFTVGWDSGVLKVWDSSNNVILTLGDWIAVQLTLNGSTGAVSFTPLYFDVSLITVADDTAYTQIVDNLITIGDISGISFSAGVGVTVPHWQIVKTTVFLNTYNTVMLDPALNIKAYFPELTDYRLNFYSFAIYGDSFTINDVPFTVNREAGTVTFTYLGVSVTQTLNNIYVSVEDGETYLNFANVNQRYDLGATDTEIITFTGYWYFTTGLYEPYTAYQTVYNWDLDGAFHADAGQCLIIFFLILGGVVLIGHVYFNVNVRVYDWIIVIFAGFFAYVYFGGLIV